MEHDSQQTTNWTPDELSRIVDSITNPRARATTLELAPRA
jgi:hypothetical protein